MTQYLLEREALVPRPLDEVFAFFAEPRNLARITPPWLAFEMVGWEAPDRATAADDRGVQSEAGPVMQRGLLLHYRVRPLIVAQRWTSEITEWDPPRGFRDEQREGPYRYWRHTHAFEERPGGTHVTDRVEYALPFGPLGRLAHLLLVQHQLRRIFAFRQQEIERMFRSGTETESP